MSVKEFREVMNELLREGGITHVNYDVRSMNVDD